MSTFRQRLLVSLNEPGFRRAGFTFIMGSMVFSALYGRDGAKAEWQHMNNDETYYVFGKSKPNDRYGNTR